MENLVELEKEELSQIEGGSSFWAAVVAGVVAAFIVELDEFVEGVGRGYGNAKQNEATV